MSDSVGGILQALYDREGKLTPELVVNEARDPAHPLHSRFEWDDNVAAEAYRRAQAANLIRSVKVTYATDEETGRDKKVRRFVSIRPPEAPDTRIYEDIEKVALDPVRRQMLLQDARRDWLRFKGRYAMLSEFFDEIVVELTDQPPADGDAAAG